MVQKIYVGNLPFDATEEQVEKAFAQFGEVSSVVLPSDRETGRPRGFGFVEMDSADAAKAIAALHNTDFGGRQLNVNEAKPREASGGGRGAGGDRGWSGGGGYARR